MRKFRKTLSSRRRGAAMIVALALTLCLTMLIVGTQLQIVTQLKGEKGQRDYDRALELAEAGANAYLNYLANGSSSALLQPWNTPPPTISATPPPTTSQIRSAILGLSGSIPLGPSSSISIPGFTVPAGTWMGLVNYPAKATLTTKPAAGSQFGYFVILTQAVTASSVNMMSYGYANGVVRRVQVGGQSSDVFDWAAVYGMDPYTNANPGPGLAANGNPTGTDTGNAWDFSGSASIVGASGGEGFINNNNNATWYDGPVILAANGNTLNATNPTVIQSGPFGSGGAQIPTGHTGTGTLANPAVRRLSRSLALETASEAANRWALAMFGQTTTAGVEFFKTATYNNNATGVRMLVKDKSTLKVRELASAWPIPTSGGSAYEFTWPGNSDRTSAGQTNNEDFIGLRVYPGTYYIQKWTQQSADVVYLRTNASSSYIGVDGTGASMPVYESTYTTITSPNPNSGMSAEKNIRFFIGNPTSGNSPSSTFRSNTFMEDTSFASRFRLYIATKGAVTVSGDNSNPPKKFRVNILCKDSVAGSGANAGKTVVYGNISIASSCYLYGSLLAWQVGVSGSCTVEKQAAEGTGGGGTSSSDLLSYMVTAWKELP